MAKGTEDKSGWLATRVENALKKAYVTIRVEPDEYLMQLRMAHGLPVQSYEGIFTIPIEQLDAIASQAIRKLAASDVDGEHARRPPLQQHVREAPG